MYLACTGVMLNGYDLLLCVNAATGTSALTMVTRVNWSNADIWQAVKLQFGVQENVGLYSILLDEME